MDFVQDILEKSPHNQKPYHVRANTLVFQKPNGGGKTAQVFSRPIAFYRAGEWQGLNPMLVDRGGFYSGNAMHFRLLPSGELQWGNSFRLWAESVGCYSIANNTYTRLADLPTHGSVQANRLRRETGLYSYETIHQGLSITGELSLLEKPPNLSGDLFVLAARVWGAELPLGSISEEGVSLQETEGQLHLHGRGSAEDALGRRTSVYLYSRALPAPVFRQLLVGVSVDWLEKANYPVVIDPSISPITDSSDAYIKGQHATEWSSAREASSSYDNGASWVTAGQIGYDGADPKEIFRGFLSFDTSSLSCAPAGIQAVSITGVLRTRAVYGGSTASYVVQANWASPMSSAVREANYDLALSASKIIEWVDSDTATTVGNSYTSPDFGSYSAIVPGGTSKLALVSSQDYDNVGLSGSGIIRYLSWYSGDHATASERVYLSIDYLDQPSPSLLSLKSTMLSPSLGIYDTRIKLRSRRRNVALTTMTRNGL